MTTEYKADGDLKAAFAGESQANRRYLFFAAKAEKEGYPQVARLFRAAAEAETVHARNHFDAMDGVGTTRENLLAAVMGEHYEFTEMYPTFIRHASEEQNERASLTFSQANEVEKIHHGLFDKYLAAVKAKQELKNEPYYVCPVCGNTVAGEAPHACPICQTPGSKFRKIE